MPGCNVNALMVQSGCLAGLNPWFLELVKTQFLCNLSNNIVFGTSVTCDISTLLESAACYNNLQPATLKVIQAQILCNLRSNLEIGTPVTCSIDSLLSDGKCFAAVPVPILDVLIARLLCEVSVLIAAGGTSHPNVIDGCLVLHNLTDGLWYSSCLVMVGPDALFTPPAITATPPLGTPDTVTVADPDDLTTHVVGVDTDGGGSVSLVVAQADAGTPGESLVLTADDLSTHALRIIADSGGVYQLIAV